MQSFVDSKRGPMSVCRQTRGVCFHCSFPGRLSARRCWQPLGPWTARQRRSAKVASRQRPHSSPARASSGSNGVGPAGDNPDGIEGETVSGTRSGTVEDEEWTLLHRGAGNRIRGADAERMRQARTNSTGNRASTIRQAADEGWRSRWKQFWGRASYQYFNWRRDTSSDLLLFAGFNVGLLLTGGILKRLLVDQLDGSKAGSSIHALWLDIWAVLVVVLGQELPDKAASFADQFFALLIAATGLAAFALVLALIEQVVLEVLERRVSIGSPVYEAGHIVILGWLENQRDEEVLWKLLSQLCQAYRNDGGRVVVVMTRQPKLHIEATFRRIIPDSLRFGSTFVFRQGSPLVPADLRAVAASQASSVVVISDRSRPPEEADAQAVRAAVLLDELDFPGFGVADPRKAPILVEVKTHNAVRLLQYSCSKRVLALPTAQANARRICRMVRSPVVGSISTMLFSFNYASQAFLEYFPHLEGQTVGELPFFFPDGIVFGLYNHATGNVRMNPPPADVVEPGDELLIIRPTSFPSGTYRPAPHKKLVNAGDWSPVDYSRHSIDESPLGGDSDILRVGNSGTPVLYTGKIGYSGSQSAGLFTLPLDNLSRSSDPQRLLICGFLEATRMGILLRELDRGTAALPRGSEVVLFNQHPSSEVLGRVVRLAKVQNITCLHIQGNPLDQQDLKDKLNLARFQCAILLCDHSWVDPDLQGENGVLMGKVDDMLRMDAMVLVVQLNLRSLLEEAGFPNINLICEKVSFEGVTRFEDKYRLPMGISVNQSGFSATLMAEAVYNPKILLPYSRLGEKNEMVIQDVSAFAAKGELLSFWQLQKRVSMVGQVLYGFYRIPTTVAEPIDIVINPCGDDVRSLQRVWNMADARRKVITMAPREPSRSPGPDAYFVESAIRRLPDAVPALSQTLKDSFRGLPSVR